jgi:hypothetical protein
MSILTSIVNKTRICKAHQLSEIPNTKQEIKSLRTINQDQYF